MVKQMTAQGQPDSPQLRGAIKEELINREILMQEADKQGLSNSSDVKNQLELARQSIVIRALIADYLKKNPVSDADIKAEYDKFKAQAGDKEYHARHILVDKKEDAEAIIAKLKAAPSSKTWPSNPRTPVRQPTAATGLGHPGLVRQAVLRRHGGPEEG
jgi:peptidyl-prolyl cis-trans isomerase C